MSKHTRTPKFCTPMQAWSAGLECLSKMLVVLNESLWINDPKKANDFIARINL